MNILMIYPQYPETFWSFKHSLTFVSKKALMPPLGLLTVASILPSEWNKKLIDLNVEELKMSDVIEADYIIISAMISQKESTKEVIDICKSLNKPIIAGGPLFTSLYKEFPQVDIFTLGEGELTIPELVKDLINGKPKKIYDNEIKPDIKASPVPMWSLVKQKYYMRMPIQYSRGCPFDCEFCDVVKLNGVIPRTKSSSQIIKELEALRDAGWKGPIFFVDDNFIGNKKDSKKLLQEIISWRKRVKFKSTFMTEVSLNLADDQELMDLMIMAGFNSVFVGLETPSQESLSECGKMQNINRNLVESVTTLYKNGFEVSAGFIVGFDSDDNTIFKRQIDFIQKTGVVIAMISLLQALPGTRLYERLKREQRLISTATGNNTDFSINFKPVLPQNLLIDGYKNIISSVYSAKNYYNRVLTFAQNYNHYIDERINFDSIIALLKSVYYMGVLDSSRLYYWKLFFISLLKYPKAFPKVITMSIYYAHFKKIFINNKLTTA